MKNICVRDRSLSEQLLFVQLLELTQYSYNTCIKFCIDVLRIIIFYRPIHNVKHDGSLVRHSLPLGQCPKAQIKPIIIVYTENNSSLQRKMFIS